MKFKPLEDNLAEILTETANQILPSLLPHVTPDGVKTLYLEDPVQVQAVFKAMCLYNLVVKKIKEMEKCDSTRLVK